jgi:hypothetical protein
MRYKLMMTQDGETSEVGGQRKSTKHDIDEWVAANDRVGRGIDWSVGYMIKFRDNDTVYNWQWIKDGSDVRYG